MPGGPLGSVPVLAGSLRQTPEVCRWPPSCGACLLHNTICIELFHSAVTAQRSFIVNAESQVRAEMGKRKSQHAEAPSPTEAAYLSRIVRLISVPQLSQR